MTTKGDERMIKSTRCKILTALSVLCLLAAGARVSGAQCLLPGLSPTGPDSDFLEAMGVATDLHQDVAFVGAPGRGEKVFSGSVLVYERDENERWSVRDELVPSDPETVNDFGISLSSSGEWLFVGAPGGVSFEPKAFVFRNTGGVWTETQVLQSGSGDNLDLFGRAVAVEGSRALITAPVGFGSSRLSEIFYYELEGDQWVEKQMFSPTGLFPGQQAGIAMDLDGDRAVFGAGSGVEAAYLFDYDGEQWLERDRVFSSDGGPFDGFGEAVAFVGDRLLVGATRHSHGDVITQTGGVYSFDLRDGVWTPGPEIVAPNLDETMHHGNAIAAGSDFVLIGAARGGHPDSPLGGSVGVYRMGESGWQEQARLTPSREDELDAFGASLAVSGSNVLIGATSYGAGGAAFFTMVPDVALTSDVMETGAGERILMSICGVRPRSEYRLVVVEADGKPAAQIVAEGGLDSEGFAAVDLIVPFSVTESVTFQSGLVSGEGETARSNRVTVSVE